MYRPNLPHHNLPFCDGDCFDDLCSDCKDCIKSSDDEGSSDQLTANQFTRYRQRSASSYSTDCYSSDEEACDQAVVELKRMSKQVSDLTKSLEKHFQTFNRDLDHLDDRLLQLHRHNGHCSDLLSTFDDYLQSLQEQVGSAVNCDEWFMQVDLLKVMLNKLSDVPNIQHLNGRMKCLYDFFIKERYQPPNCQTSQTMENLARQWDHLRFLRSQIAIAELELNGLNRYLEEQLQIIAEFVGAMKSIVQSVQSALVSNEVATEFDCFSGRQFLKRFTKTLNQIQIN